MSSIFPGSYLAGKDDEVNIAASMAFGPLLDKAKPRVLLFENVPGLMERCKVRFSGKFTDDEGSESNVRNCWDRILLQFRDRSWSIC